MLWRRWGRDSIHFPDLLGYPAQADRFLEGISPGRSGKGITGSRKPHLRRLPGSGMRARPYSQDTGKERNLPMSNPKPSTSKFGLPACPYCGKRLNPFVAWSYKSKGEFYCKKCGKYSNIGFSGMTVGAGFVRHWRQRGAVAFIFISFWYESLGGFIYCHPFPGILFVYAVPGAPAPHPGFPIPPGCAAVLPPVFPIPAGPAARQDSPATGPASSQPALAASSGQPDRVGTLCAALFCGAAGKIRLLRSRACLIRWNLENGRRGIPARIENNRPSQ